MGGNSKIKKQKLVHKPFKVFRRNRRFTRFLFIRRRIISQKLRRQIINHLSVNQFIKGYFGFLRTGQFISFVRAARKVPFMTKLHSVVSSLEQRLVVLFYRSRYIQNLHRCKEFVKAGHLKVNGKVITYSNYLVQPGDMLQMRPQQHGILIEKKIGRIPFWKRLSFTWQTSNFLYTRKRIGIMILKYFPQPFNTAVPFRKMFGFKKTQYVKTYFQEQFCDTFARKSFAAGNYFFEPLTLSCMNSRYIRRMFGVFQLKYLEQRFNKLG